MINTSTVVAVPAAGHKNYTVRQVQGAAPYLINRDTQMKFYTFPRGISEKLRLLDNKSAGHKNYTVRQVQGAAPYLINRDTQMKFYTFPRGISASSRLLDRRTYVRPTRVFLESTAAKIKLQAQPRSAPVDAATAGTFGLWG